MPFLKFCLKWVVKTLTADKVPSTFKSFNDKINALKDAPNVKIGTSETINIKLRMIRLASLENTLKYQPSTDNKFFIIY